MKQNQKFKFSDYWGREDVKYFAKLQMGCKNTVRIELIELKSMFNEFYPKVYKALEG